MDSSSKILALDLGGTNLRGAYVQGEAAGPISNVKVHAKGSMEEVMQQVFEFADKMIDASVTALGVGVPGMVDMQTGMVYDVQHIPAWKQLDLRNELQQRYHLPVMINNDANCFALGEQFFGSGRNANSLIGLTIGTGLGAGIVINKKIYTGATGGAGEFGMVDYLQHNYEYYASGRFFEHVYGIQGMLVYEQAKQGDKQALLMYSEFGRHLGNAIKMVLYAYDPEVIVLGGAVRLAWPFFSSSMWEQVKQFAYSRAVKQLKILPSVLENSGILGAAALHYK